MDNRELDEILAEIRQRAATDKESGTVSEKAPVEIQHEEIPSAEKETISDPNDIFTIVEDVETDSAESDIQNHPLSDIIDTDDIISDETEPEQQEQPEPLMVESVDSEVDLNEMAEEDDEPEKNGGKKALIIALIVMIVLAAGVGVYFGFFFNKGSESETSSPQTTDSTPVVAVTEENGGILNPLTGESGYNEAAVGKRPVAVVVENEYSTASVRPQWGIEEADMIMEGETEYSTRMLFFWADYTNMPDEIGPTRSARPPFIRFSQLFDSIFIHAGLSHSKGNYVGADTVFTSENVDHINLLSLEENGTYFGRDKSRTSTIEHTGYLNGNNTAQLIAGQDIRTELNGGRFTQFEFNSKAEKPGTTEAKRVYFKWSDRCPKTAKFTYIENEGIYRTADFDSRYGEADLQFETIILLLDETEYIVKENYKTAGNSETYCDYHLAGGRGTIVSEGTALDITWDIEDNKLVMKKTDGSAVKLNPGKIYIGYGSSNHGGGVTLESNTTETDDNND